MKKQRRMAVEQTETFAEHEQQPVMAHTKHKQLEPRNEIQARYIHTIGDHVVTFATGPAGTGKTHIPTALAAAALHDGIIKRIILTRPAVGADEDLGFLPGNLEEKYEPYLGPFVDIFHDCMGASQYEYAVKAGKIVGMPLAFMRGRTFKDAFVILDEAQNVTGKQMLMFLTRVGPNCRVVVCGDLKQIDIEQSGLADAIARMQRVRRAGFIEFGREDIVRHGFVQDVVEAWEQ